MGRKLDELVLPTTKMFPVTGEQGVWRKTGLQEVLPGLYEIWRFQAPARVNVVMDKVEITANDPVSEEFGTVDFFIGDQIYRPDESLFRPDDTDGALQTRHPDQIYIPSGSSFSIRFSNQSNVFAVWFNVDFRVFAERVVN